MDFINKLTSLLPFGKKEKVLEYYFALNISSAKLTAALWTIENRELKIFDLASEVFSSLDDLSKITDKLLDQVLGMKEVDVSKILFGVPSTWLSDEELKDEYLKILRKLVKELELVPMAYVETANALVHFLEKQDGIPPTAVLVGFEKQHLRVAVVRAGKLDGVKVVSRDENPGVDLEKALLSFTTVETLPSKILIYGPDISELKNQLLSYPWMSKLSFLHFPKIDILQEDVEIKSICLAGASEIEANVYFKDHEIKNTFKKSAVIDVKDEESEESEELYEPGKTDEVENLGFVVGDIAERKIEPDESKEKEDAAEESGLAVPAETSSLAEIEDFEQETTPPKKFDLRLPFQFPEKFKNLPFLIGVISVLFIILTAYFFLPKAEVKIFVEPKILERDAQVIADLNQKGVNEDAKIIPGQIVSLEVSASSKETATGKKQIGDPAKGTVVVYNKTSDSKNISKGTTLTSSSGLKFTLDVSVNIASQSATDSGITYGKSNATVTALSIGPDSNLPSATELTVNNFSSSQVSAKAEGNFSGGTSKDVTVVSESDQQKLLAALASNLRRQAKDKLQESLLGKKILEEALLEEITKKSYSKNVNDQANEFSLNLTAKYKGTAFDEKDLKQIVGKLVTTQVPEGFQLDLAETETQADVSKLEKDGKLIFLARFKAKLLPKIDTNKLKDQIKGKSVSEVEKNLKNMENVLGSEIRISPSLPPILQRLPILGRNIQIQVGLK